MSSYVPDTTRHCSRIISLHETFPLPAPRLSRRLTGYTYTSIIGSTHYLGRGYRSSRLEAAPMGLCGMTEGEGLHSGVKGVDAVEDSPHHCKGCLDMVVELHNSLVVAAAVHRSIRLKGVEDHIRDVEEVAYAADSQGLCSRGWGTVRD